MAKQTALIAASYEYQDGKLQKLRAPALDAEQLARVLRDPDVGDFDVRVLPNRPDHIIRKEIGRFFAEGKKDDLLLLYFSCHGVKDDDGNLYFAAVDTDVGNLDGTAVSADWVSRQITKSWSRRVLLLLDCCYSGAFASGLVAKGDTKVHIKERFAGDGRGRVVLTASDDMEYAWEGDTLSGEGQPSVFTRALVEGLETGEADRDRDGYVAVDELYEYVYDRVVESTPNQKPNMWTFDLEGRLRIARSRFASDLALLPADLRVAIASPLVGVREGAVQELGRLLKDGDVAVAKGARAALVDLAGDSSSNVAVAAQATLEGFAGDEGMTIVIPGASQTRETDEESPSVESIDLTDAPAKPEPEAAEPEVVEPEVAEQEAAEQEVVEPEVAEPEVDEPDSQHEKPEPRWFDRLKPRAPLIAVAVVAVVVAAAALWPDGGGEEPAQEALAPEVLFVRDGMLYGMAPDGTGIDDVDGAPPGIGEPARSHDGKRIAYVKNHNLFVMGVDGAEPRRLTDSELHDDHPEWSPDDKWIAFSREREDGTNSDIWVIEVDTGDLTQLTFTPEIVEAGPTWSPDGDQIAFRQGDPTEGTGIFAVDFPDGDSTTDGTGRETVVPVTDGANQRAPSWSPDENNPLIVFRRGPALHTVHVRSKVVDEFKFADGAPSDMRMPVWSPDGSAIIFVAKGSRGDIALYRVESDGTGLKELAENASEPSWTGSRPGLEQ